MKSHIFKFIPLVAAAAVAMAVSPLQAAPRGGHGGGGHSGGGRMGGGHFGGGGRSFARGGGAFRGGGGRAFVHGGRVFRGGPGFRGRPWGWGGPYVYGGWGLGYPYYDYPYYGYPYVDSYGDGGVVDSGATATVDDTATTVQQALANAGYYHGPIDGIIGAGSTGAISAYQRDHGLPVTGTINAALLHSLGIS